MTAPLTDEELACLRRNIYTGTCGDPDCDCTPETCAISREADINTRLLDEHAELKRSQCTEEERAVLKGVANIPDKRLQDLITFAEMTQRMIPELDFSCAEIAMAKAELARREAERAKGGAK